MLAKVDYEKLQPYAQGYAVYWEGDQPGSELHGFTNPYAAGSKEHAEWNRGQMAATLDAQDGDD